MKANSMSKSLTFEIRKVVSNVTGILDSIMQAHQPYLHKRSQAVFEGINGIWS